MLFINYSSLNIKQMKQYHIFHAISSLRFTETKSQPRQYVGFVEADSIEKAFEYAQNDHVDWAMNEVRSTSVGDVIQDHDRFFMVCGIGFKELVEPQDPDLATLADQEEEMKYLE
jgi:hypothetical protein